MPQTTGRWLVCWGVATLVGHLAASCHSPEFDIRGVQGLGGASGAGGTQVSAGAAGQPVAGAAGQDCQDCTEPSCSDDLRNGDETDVDCGGSKCEACTRGKVCIEHDDCVTGTCDARRCVLTCVQGTGDCDGDDTNDCETNLKTSPQHCGACGAACNLAHATSACLGGTCAIVECDAPFLDCDGQPDNGCEVNSSTNSSNCGACGITCVGLNGTPVCAASSCAVQCDEGFGDCDGNPTNGCERDLRRDVNNCGACGNVCDTANGTPWCSEGDCGVSQCPTGMGDCNAMPVDGCEVDLTVDAMNCGSCGSLCLAANGAAVCDSALCQIESCSEGFDDCNAGTPEGLADGCETNLNSDPNNCGACGDACQFANATPQCSAGNCGILSCTAPWADCDGDGQSCEINTNTNSENCGGCGSNGLDCQEVWGGTRHADSQCTLGACEFSGCQGTWRNCNAETSDGCESNIQSNNNHCGSCNVACEAPFGTNTCTSGVCVPNCGTDYLDCDADVTTGCEVDPETDADHCGGCGSVCQPNNTSANVCSNGTCDPTCLVGYADCDSSRANGCEVTGFCDDGGPGTLLFFDDFENGTALWQTNLGGNWSVVSDGTSVYAQSETTNNLRMAEAGPTNWTDVMAEVRVKALSFNGTSTSFLAGLCLRRQNANNLYVVGIRSDGRVGARRRINGSYSNIGNSDANLVSTGVWYTMRAEFFGSNLSVYLNDNLVFAVTDTTHASGGFGLCTVNTSAVFDDVSVRAPD